MNQWRGARWLSGRVSDSGARGRGFEAYRRHVVSLSKALYSPKVLVNYPGSGGSVPTWLKKLLTGTLSLNTNKQTNQWNPAIVGANCAGPDQTASTQFIPFMLCLLDTLFDIELQLIKLLLLSQVFVGKIPKDVFEDELIPLIENCGRIWDLRLMMDPMTGFNRGYCFVTFCDKDGAQEAVKQVLHWL